MTQELAARGALKEDGTAHGETCKPLLHHFASEPIAPPPETLPDKPRSRRRGAKCLIVGRLPGSQQSSIDKPSGPPVIETKLAMARIKRIIQADKDIGKLAKVIPVLIAEALELFMISVCEKTVEQARRTKSKRITPSHMKEAVMQEELFDFLRDFFIKVPNL